MKLVNKFLGLKKNNRNAYIFFAVMCIFLIMFFVGCIISTCAFGKRFFITELVFWLDDSDWFMDFFNVNEFVKDMNPYLRAGSNYPPLALLIAKVFSICADYSISAKTARISVGGIISLFVFFAIFYIVSFILLRKVCKKHGIPIWGTFAIFAGLFITAPNFYVIERGNYLLLALMFIAIFMVYYKDERKWVREFSYVALAVAAGIKLYPAAFALVLLKDKRFIDFGKVVLYSALLFFLPFLAFKGGFIENIEMFLSTLINWSGTPSVDAANMTNLYSCSISVKTQFLMLCSKITDKRCWLISSGVDDAGLAFGILIAVAMVAVSLFSKSDWRRLSAIGLIVTLFPSISYYYSVTFMFIPFIAFIINEDADKRKIGYWIFYFIILCPISIGFFIQPKTCGLVFGYTLMNWLQGLSMIAMAIMLFVETLVEFIKERKLKKIENAKA